MFRRVSLMPILAALLAWTAPLSAVGGSIADGPVTLTYPANHWTGTPRADLVGTETVAGSDVVYESGWWYRIESVDTAEHPMPAPTTETYDAGLALMTATWINLAGSGVDVIERTWVVDNERPSGSYVTYVSATNNGASDVTLSLFHYLDADVGGTDNGDSASLVGSKFLAITDTTGSVVRYRAPRALAYKVGAFSSVSGIRGELNDTGITNFANTGLPAGPGDLTAAFQWPPVVLASGGTTFPVAEISVSSRLLRHSVKGDDCQSGYPSIFFTYAPTGAPLVWCMRRTSAMRSTYYGAPTGNRRLVAVDDFNADYVADWVERDMVTGAVYARGTALTGAATLPLNWKLSATADFNADGKPDIVWRNTTSQKLVIWTMDGVAKVGNIIPSPDQAVDANWEVAAALDFNADGNTDFLWYNATSGKIVIWTMNSAVQRTSGAFTTPSNAGNNNWRVVAGGDFGLGAGTEGTPVLGSQDILWRNETSGNLVVWHMNLSGQRTSGTFTSPVSGGGTDYVVVGPR